MISEETRALRSTGIGGSDIGAIMGLSRFRTPYDVFLEKTGQKPDTPDNQAIHWGNILEDVVAKEYQTTTGRKVQRINKMLRHPDYEFVIGNIDRAVVNPDIKGNVRWKDGRLTTDRILECKTANGFTAKLWGEAGTDYVPDAYMAQVQWYLLLTGCQYADLAVLIGGQDFRTFHINRDEGLIDIMLGEAINFWRNTQAGIAPAPSSAEECAQIFSRAKTGKTIELDEDLADGFKRLSEIKTTIAELAEEADTIKTKIMHEMQDAEEATLNGIPVCSWKNVNSSRFDRKAFKAAYPDLEKQFTTPTESRRFTLKGI